MPQCSNDKPRVRWMQPQLLQLEGETVVALSDPAGLSEGVIVLSPQAYQLTQLMDGLLERPEILRQAQRRWGFRLQPEQLDGLIAQLDEHFVLDGPKSRGYLESLPYRPAAHAGGAYPAEPEKLRSFLDSLLEASPAPPAVAANAYLIPHIDPLRGKESYASAWRHLQGQPEQFDLCVVLGISHAFSHNPFILTRKNFQTPLGVVETAQDVVSALAEDVPFDPFLDEFNHFGEHSIEFQLIFLQHLWPRPVAIVPILCGSFHEWLGEAGGWPEQSAAVSRFLQRLEVVLKDRPRTCWIASVDLAHVGERFGGAALSVPELEKLESLDRQSLEAATRGDAHAFFSTLQADRGERNYCGTSAIYSLLSVLKPGPGQLLHYQQCNEPGLSSTVTVCSALYPA